LIPRRTRAIATPSFFNGFHMFWHLEGGMPLASLDQGGSMRTTAINLLLFLGVCGLTGCASKTVETPSVEAQPAPQQSVAATKPQQIPPRPSPPAVKPEKTPAKTVKPAAETHQQVKSATKEETTESKPAEMKVANSLDRDPYLSSVVKPLLPPRMTVTNAAMGFKNERDFIAALHVSKNLAIPFDQIKTRMTAAHRMSLTDSLRDIRSQMSKKDAKGEVKKAEEQAKGDEKHARDEAKLLSASSRK
jgi:hypothetical protein